MNKLKRTFVRGGGASYLTPSRILGQIQVEKKPLLFNRIVKSRFFNVNLDISNFGVDL